MGTTNPGIRRLPTRHEDDLQVREIERRMTAQGRHLVDEGAKPFQTRISLALLANQRAGIVAVKTTPGRTVQSTKLEDKTMAGNMFKVCGTRPIPDL